MTATSTRSTVMASRKISELLRFTMPPEPTSELPAPLLPHLFLGTEAHARSVKLLKRFQITDVINCCENHTGKDHYDELAEAGIRVFGFSTEDSLQYPILESCYDEVKRILDDVQRRNGRCLIHCQAGVNRSGVLAIAYVADATGATVLEAAKDVKARRGRVCTNPAFQQQLIEFASARGWRCI